VGGEDKKKDTEPEAQLYAGLACGRTVDEQVKTVRRYGNHAVAPALKASVLAAHCITKPKERAGIAVMQGCYLPFSSPFLLRDYFRLLDLLAIDYTWLDQEFCCGLPLLLQSAKEEQGKTMASCKEFIRMNSGQAQKQGATTLAYCCVGCAHATKGLFPNEADRHVYVLDLIADKLENKTLQIPPATVGYFEGCHTTYRAHYPRTHLDWNRYRRLLGAIEGLTVVDLENDLCCKRASAEIIEQAEKVKLDKILCACNGCALFLGGANQGTVQILSYPGLLLEGLGAS
jgi:Fe-S oxidoreductase